MRPLLLLPAALLALAASPALGTDALRGLDRPVVKLEWKLGHDARGEPGRVATRACWVYRRHAVLFSDEGEMGAADLEIRVRPAGMTPVTVCGASFRGRVVRPATEEETEPVGVFDRWLVTVHPDVFGALGRFALFDLEKGTRAFGDTYASAQGITFERGPAGPTLTYWAALAQFGCAPRRGDAACWASIQAKHGLPARLPAPDCEAAIATRPEALLDAPSRSLQLTVHVRVPRLRRKDAVVLPDRPGCDPSP